ncbi:unnamed protein product, partial [Rangifer tarandus platyrhynchus]
GKMGSQINEAKEERTIFSRSPGGKHTEVTVLHRIHNAADEKVPAVVTSSRERAWSDGNAPPALLSVRYVAEPGSLTCLSPSALRKPAAASGLLGAPEEGYLVWR